MRHPLIRLVLGLVLGLAGGLGSGHLLDPARWVLALVGLAALGALARWPAGRLVAVGLALGAALSVEHDSASPLPIGTWREGGERAVQGVLIEPVRRRRERLEVVLTRVETTGGPDVRSRDRMRLSLPDASWVRRLRVGQTIQGFVSPRAVRPVPNPGVRDPAEILLRRGIVATARGGDHGPLRVTGEATHPWRDHVRERYRRWVERRLSPEGARLAQAVILGDGAAPEDSQREPWRDSGLGHLLAISGLHVGLVAALAWRLVLGLLSSLPAWAARWTPYRPAAAATIAASWAYVAVAGAPLSATRAGWMITGLMAARLLGRGSDVVSALSLALLLVVAADPTAPADPAFQLSFAAVGALLLVMPRLDRWAREAAGSQPFVVLDRPVRWLLSTGGASLVCTLATLPFAAWHFQTIPLAAVPVNLLAIPLSAVGVVIPGLLGLAWVAVGGVQGGWLAVWLDLGTHVAQRLAEGASRTLPPLPLPGWSGAEAALLAGAAVAALWTLRRPGRRPVLVALSMALLATGFRVGWPRAPAELRATFLAVGHGDAVVVQLPDGRTLLADAGGDPLGHRDPGENLVVPALEALGVDRIDVMVVSHPHPDHYLGLRAVARRFEVGEVWTTGLPDETREYDQLMALLRARRARFVTFSRGPPVRWLGPVRVEALHPLPAGDRGWFPELGANDNSLVLRLEYGDFRLLLTGDIEGPAEARLVRSGTDLRATVLKVPHHGSRTSSSETFLRAVTPILAVAQCADGGRFPFPHTEVEARYRALGIPLWITGRTGALQVRTDGQSVHYERW